MRQYNCLLTALFALLLGVFGTLVFLRADRETGIAWGQQSAASGYMIGLLGEVSGKDVPIVLVDTRAQTILVYQYNIAREEMEFIQARTYRYEKELEEYPPGSGKKISVEEVKRYFERRGRD